MTKRVLAVLVAVFAIVALSGCEILDQLFGWVPPGTPMGLTVVDNGDGTLGISWFAVSDADTYYLEASTDGFTFSDAYGGPATSVIHTDVLANVTYYYRVLAQNEYGDSGYSATASGMVVATTLEIVNDTSYDIDFVTWTAYDSTVYYFGDDSVYDEITMEYELGIAAYGGSYSQQVTPGSDSIYFYFTNSDTAYYTDDVVTVEQGQSVTYTFTNETYIWSAAVGAPSQQLGDIVAAPPSDGAPSGKASRR